MVNFDLKFELCKSFVGWVIEERKGDGHISQSLISVHYPTDIFPSISLSSSEVRLRNEVKLFRLEYVRVERVGVYSTRSLGTRLDRFE